MRGFTKAAALLSLTRASTFVIPDSSTLPASPVTENHPRDALAKFDSNSAVASPQDPAFTFQVKGTDRACGESHVFLNDLELDSDWDGTTAHGREYLDLYGGREAEWHISCLFNTVPAGGSYSNGEDVVHVLSLRVGSSVDNVQVGFTISYKQKDRPAILRFQQQYHPFNLASRPEFAALWRTPSLDFDPEVLDNAQKSISATMHGSLSQKQKSLGAYLQALQVSLKKEVNEVINHFCPKHNGQGKTKAPAHVVIPSDRLLEPPPIAQEEPVTSSDTVETTNTISNAPAAETRSLTALDSFNPSATSTDAPLLPPPNEHNLHLLKVFALVLILGSCFTWIFLRCRDPRRRAECLARQEERRNRKLYRRAAREHKIKMWFWNFRVKYGFAPSEVLSWDEKRIRVNQQEEILEAAMTNDIRALRNAHRVVSTVTAAEEGRNAFAYDSEGSERRRSYSTLPGYESESSQPPTYDDLEGGLDGTAVVNGFRFVPAETEFNSDSSVISTSPRISRDGTNSDFDEKIEPISLGPTESTARVYDHHF